MHELLQGLGMTESIATAIEIILYVILVISGIIAIIKYTIAIIVKLVPKFKEIKSFKHKLIAVKTFCKWYRKSIKDGVLSSDEIDEINAEFDNIINGVINKEYICSCEECSKLDKADSQVVSSYPEDGDDD